MRREWVDVTFGFRDSRTEYRRHDRDVTACQGLGAAGPAPLLSDRHCVSFKSKVTSLALNKELARVTKELGLGGSLNEEKKILSVSVAIRKGFLFPKREDPARDKKAFLNATGMVTHFLKTRSGNSATPQVVRHDRCRHSRAPPTIQTEACAAGHANS